MSFLSKVKSAFMGSPALTTPSMPKALLSQSTFAQGLPSSGFASSANDNSQDRDVWSGFRSMAGSYTLQTGGYLSRDRNAAISASQQLAISDPIISTIIMNGVTHAVGTGLNLSMKLDPEALGLSPDVARKFGSQIEKAWIRWSKDALEVDLAGRHNLDQLASAAFESFMRSGEVLALLRWKKVANSRTRTKVQLLQTSQLDQQRNFEKGRDGVAVQNGVEFNGDGRVIAYHIREFIMGHTLYTPLPVRIPAFTGFGRRNVIYLFQLRDGAQVRGYPVVAPALTPAQSKAVLQETTLTSANVQAQIAITLESSLPGAQALNNLKVDDGLGYEQPGGVAIAGSTEADRAAFYARLPPKLGSIAPLPKGDSLKLHRAQNPSAGYLEFDASLSRQASKSAGMSAEDVSGDYSKTSFSASRLSAETPHRITMQRRADIAAAFYQQTFEAWLEEALATNEIKMPAGVVPYYGNQHLYHECKWLGIGKVSADKLKDAQATVLEIEEGLGTLSSALAERGLDFETVAEERAQEMRVLKELGLWREPKEINPKGPTAPTPDNEDDIAAEDIADEGGASPLRTRKPKR
ncbi:phage portal protein [Tardiphaga sp. vice304]|uniref:phage portal protein n=1 Tax=Tardiphaga sp. vice304 TaxID=2592817 RepID=UPI001164A08F|nr:phage portal protein [Tardiphaga sp. vice304]QDM28397.1 phage portal protein [Tardiphaga sp. vice304]